MLSNPLTPPQESSACGNSNVDDGVTIGTSTSEYSNQQFSTPMSNASIDLELQDERPSIEECSNIYDISDDEQDMSGGGAHLVMTISHEEQSNTESDTLDTMDADAMGPENLAGLFMDEHHYPSGPAGQFEAYLSNSDDEQIEPDFDHELHDPGYSEEPSSEIFQFQAQAFSSQLPTTMSAVSLQLQQMQDGQGHADFMEADDLHQDNNSIPSIFLPFFPQIKYFFNWCPGCVTGRPCISGVHITSDSVVCFCKCNKSTFSRGS
jgi:hypothetical protein